VRLTKVSVSGDTLRLKFSTILRPSWPEAPLITILLIFLSMLLFFGGQRWRAALQRLPFRRFACLSATASRNTKAHWANIPAKNNFLSGEWRKSPPHVGGAIGMAPRLTEKAQPLLAVTRRFIGWLATAD